MENKAQSVIEYTLVLCLIILALISMQTYIKRGIQGNLKYNADSIGGIYYSPKATTSEQATNQITKTLRETSDNKTTGDLFFGFNQDSTSSLDIVQENNVVENTLSYSEEPRR